MRIYYSELPSLHLLIMFGILSPPFQLPILGRDGPRQWSSSTGVWGTGRGCASWLVPVALGQPEFSRIWRAAERQYLFMELWIFCRAEKEFLCQHRVWFRWLQFSDRQFPKRGLLENVLLRGEGKTSSHYMLTFALSSTLSPKSISGWIKERVCYEGAPWTDPSFPEWSRSSLCR